ncbi:MAG: helix-turn-helix transcriptional regulator [Burkholderiales bacterium]|nr:helix-turn-helix transcriptional regulator [Burkholderiales bacterium]
MATKTEDGGGVPACLVAAVNRLAFGMAVLDIEGTLHFANTAALAAIRRTGWQLSDGRLQPPAEPELSAWRRALSEVCVGERHRLIEIQAGETTLFVSLSSAHESAHDGGRAWAIATFEREELCGPLELQMFSSRHGLTLAENQVLQRLCRGERPAEIAREHGVARSTVLTQVAAIRSKTHRGSVLELLHKLSRMPAVRPAGLVS